MFRFLLISSFLLMGCASHMKSGIKPKEQTYEPKQISFTEIDTNTSVTLSDYMENTHKDWLLLYFHSRTCTACVEKMRRIRDEVTPDTFKNPAFEIVGVSADPASSLELVKRFKAQNNFPFVKWLDDRGEVLKDNFLPSNKVGVPFVALVSKDKILWSYTNDQELSYDEMIAKVKETVPEKQEDKYKFLYKQRTVGLSELLGGAEYTVVNVFYELCLSCIEEIEAWSKPDQAMTLCQKPKCQFLNLENGVPEEEPQADRLNRLQADFEGKGIAIELMLDPKPSDGDGYKDRYFDGFLTEKYPEWGGLFGAVVYHNGEIVKDFVSGDGTAVTEYIKTLQ